MTSRPRDAISPGCSSCLPGVVDTRNREAPGWESMNNLTINGRASFNFSYDGVTNKDTGQNGGNFAAPALDSIAEIRVQTSNFQAEYGRSSGATITVVTRSGSRDFRWQRGVLQARRRVERQRVLAAHSVPDAAGAVRAAALHVRQHGVDARRTGAHPETRLQPEPRQAVLLLVAGPPRPHRPRQPESAAGADRARASGRFLADRSTTRVVWSSSAIRCSQGNCAATTGGPACFPGNVIPSNRIDANARSASEPVSAAERHRSDRHQPVQLRVPDGAGLAAQRSGACASTGTSRRIRRRTDACSSGTKSVQAASRCSARPAAGRRCRRSTRSTPSAT